MGAAVSWVKQWFTGPPEEYNSTNADILNHNERVAKAKIRLEEMKRQEAVGRGTQTQKEKEQGQKGFQSAKDRTQYDSENPDIQNHNDMVIEAKRRLEEMVRQETEDRKAADRTMTRKEQVREDFQLVKSYTGSETGIQPEVWPTKEDFRSAKVRIQYDPTKLHFAVCGSSGTGKSSLINAFRGLKSSNESGSADTGLVETTKTITRYPDHRQELPYKRFVWFDCPGAGTLKIPGWQYFNEQGLFIFDIIILVYDTRFTQIDVSIVQNCERFKIPLFIVRSKADNHIRDIMENKLGYDEDDVVAEGTLEEYRGQARQLLIDVTRKNLEENLESAGLEKRDIFIVSSKIIYSLITGKGSRKKTTPAIDEARLIENILKCAYARRYGDQAPSKNLLTFPAAPSSSLDWRSFSLMEYQD